MKLLLDSCVWGGAVRDLQAEGHDVDWAGTWTVDPGDEEILRHAHAEGRVLVTIDKDLGELTILQRQSHHGIIRLVDFSARQHGRACLHVLRNYCEELTSGAIITAQPGRVRVRSSGKPEE